MSTATTTDATEAGTGSGAGRGSLTLSGSATPLGGPGSRFLDLLAAEWIKLRSVRSTYWALLCAAVPSILVGILIAQNVRSDWANLITHPDFKFDSLASSFDGFEFSQLVMGVLGVLVISSEYSS